MSGGQDEAFYTEEAERSRERSRELERLMAKLKSATPEEAREINEQIDQLTALMGS